ncbi:MAG: CBU_0592 family membrane protein [Alphaproteobacteria bacterium]
MSDYIGLFGVFLVVSTYLFMQIGRLDSKSKYFDLLNLVGSGCILFSLFFAFNLPSAVIQILWIIISVVGLIKDRK